jgi:drug/metabolite transporter (DMT)-like permease
LSPAPAKRHLPLAMLAAAGVGIQVGAATVASRFAIGETDPFTLGLWRYAIGVICLLPFVVRQERVRFAARDLLPMALLGIIQFGVLVALLNTALQTIPAARAAVIFALFPLLTMLLAAITGRERMTWPKSVGVALAVLGVAIALGEQATAFGQSSLQGDVAMFAAAMCGAVCSVLYGPYLKRYPALAVGTYAMACAAMALGAAVWMTGRPLLHWPYSPTGFASVVFIGLSSGLGYTALLWALANTTPTKVTVFQTLAPLAATGLGFVFLGETVTVPFLIGLAVVVCGLWVAHWPVRPASTGATASKQTAAE